MENETISKTEVFRYWGEYYNTKKAAENAKAFREIYTKLGKSEGWLKQSKDLIKEMGMDWVKVQALIESQPKKIVK